MKDKELDKLLIERKRLGERQEWERLKAGTPSHMFDERGKLQPRLKLLPKPVAMRAAATSTDEAPQIEGAGGEGQEPEREEAEAETEGGALVSLLETQPASE